MTFSGVFGALRTGRSPDLRHYYGRSLRSWTLSSTVSSEHVAAGAPSMPSAMRHVYKHAATMLLTVGLDRSLVAVACIAGSAHGALLGHGARLAHAQAAHAAATQIRRVADSIASACASSVTTAHQQTRNALKLPLFPSTARTIARSTHGVHAMAETTSWHRRVCHAHRTLMWLEGHHGGVASLGSVKGEGSCRGGGDASAGRGAPRPGGRGSGGGGGRGGGAARAVTFAEWAANVERLCAQRKPPGGRLYSAAARLADVPRSHLEPASSRERAVHLVALLLQCVAARSDLQTTPILLAASASLSAHEGLLQAAKASPALTSATRSIMGGAVEAADTWGDARAMSQLAVAQQRLDLYFEPFWQRLGADETARLGVREAANVLHAYATLVQAGSVPDTDEQLCRRLAGTVAAERKERAVAQAIANTLWALGTLGVVPDAQVLAALHTMAARLAPSMKSQGVSNTLLGLAKLGQPAGDALQRELLAAVQRQAESRSMNAQEVANCLWALSKLSWCRPGAPAVPAVAALHAAARGCAADMTSQGVSNTLLALARLRSPVGDALQATLLLAIERNIAIGNEVAASQHVANTLWSLSQLRWQRAATVSEALLGAAQRTAGSLSAEEVATSLLSLAALQWPLHASVAKALVRTAHERLPQMSSQYVANVLWAQAWFAVSKTRGLQLDKAALLSRAAELASKLTSEERSQVQTAFCWPAALAQVCLSELTCALQAGAACAIHKQSCSRARALRMSTSCHNRGACRCTWPASCCSRTARQTRRWSTFSTNADVQFAQRCQLNTSRRSRRQGRRP